MQDLKVLTGGVLTLGPIRGVTFQNGGRQDVEDNDVKILWTHFFVFVSMCVVSKYPNTPNWSSLADEAITWGSIWGL